MPDDAPPPARISHDVAKLAWPKVAPQFAWDRAAPRVLRNNDRLPAEAQEALLVALLAAMQRSSESPGADYTLRPNDRSLMRPEGVKMSFAAGRN